MESDWKKIGPMLPIWRERYLADRNARIVRILTDAAKSETDRFWEAEELFRQEAKTLRRCLDGCSRSNMWLHLLEMKAAGMIRREDLAEFSLELQKQIFGEPLSPEN
jgi:hypothetical protein